MLSVTLIIGMTGCGDISSAGKSESKVPILIVEEMDEDNYEGTEYIWDLEKCTFEKKGPFLTVNEPPIDWKWLDFFWDGGDTVYYLEDGGGRKFSFADGKKGFAHKIDYDMGYTFAVNRYLPYYDKGYFIAPHAADEDEVRYPFPDKIPKELLGDKTLNEAPATIRVDKGKVTVSFFAYKGPRPQSDEKFLLDLLIAKYPANDLSKIEWKKISIPEKYDPGSIYVGGPMRTPCIDDKIYFCGYECLICCDIRNEKIIEISDFSKINSICPDAKPIDSFFGYVTPIIEGTYEGYIFVNQSFESWDKESDEAYMTTIKAAFKDNKFVSAIKCGPGGTKEIFDSNLKRVSSYNSDLGNEVRGTITFPFSD